MFRKVALGAVGYVMEYRMVFIKALCIPFSIYLALGLLKRIAVAVPYSYVLGICAAVATLMIQTIFAVTTHRIILLGPKAVPEWGLRRWSKREMFFAIYLVALGLLMGAIQFMVTKIPDVGWFLALAISAWVLARLSLVFPLIAIDRGASFRRSWELTRNHQLLMLFVILVFPIIASVPAVLLGAIPEFYLFESILSSVATIFTVAALSVAYKILSNDMYER